MSELNSRRNNKLVFYPTDLFETDTIETHHFTTRIVCKTCKHILIEFNNCEVGITTLKCNICGQEDTIYGKT